MGKNNSKQAWMSREGPEGDCVIENDTTNTVLNFADDGVVPEKNIYTAEYTYKGYPVNLEVPYEYDLDEKAAANRKGFYVDYPIEVVELPDQPDGKRYDEEFKREGLVEAATQTKPSKELAECGLSVKSTTSEQEWSYTLYNFEGQGQVTRDDIKNLVKSIYDVLGKNINQSRNAQRDPLKKLRVRLSVSKEHGKNTSDGVSTRHEYVLSACGTQAPKRVRAKSLPLERVDSMKVNPPTSSECLNNPPTRQSRLTCEPPIGMENTDNNGTVPQRRQKSSCKKCEQRRAERQSRHRERSSSAHRASTQHATVNNQGMYHYPKRLQTGPGECDPAPGCNPQGDMSRVQDWINQCSNPADGEEYERGKEMHRHKHRSHHKQTDKTEVTCKQRHCSQYLDLATDPVTSPYHVDSRACTYLNPSPRPRRSAKQSGQHSSGKHHCKCHYEQQQSVVHRHEHHHHHNHHHYHHYVS